MKKKVLLSLFIVLSFIGYAILQGINRVSGLFGEGEGRRLNQSPNNLNPNAPLNPTTSNQAPVINQPVASPVSSAPVNNSPTPTPTPVRGGFRDGQFVGDSIDVYYGFVQVKAIVQNGKLSDVQILNYPQDRQTSQEIASMSLPTLRAEAISAQSANVDAVSGATETSRGFILSLQSALAKAQ